MDVNMESDRAQDTGMPALNMGRLRLPDLSSLEPTERVTHPPRILLLYGSLRERSYSRLLVEEADRLLRLMGCETRIFDPRELPVAGSVAPEHPKVQELRALSQWSEGQVWCSPEMHGQITGVFKNQIDWIPLEVGGMRPTQGRTLAVLQVNAGSQSFNAVNSMRILGRWMRMFTIPNQSSVPKGLRAVRRGRANAAVAALRPGGRRHGGTRPIHVAAARPSRTFGGPLQ
jgi:arsenic resistance protein ArsH